MTFKTWVAGIIVVLNKVVVPVIFALAFLVFIFGVVKFFFLSSDNEKGRESGRAFMFWGILGIAMLLSVWGFVSLLLSTLGISPSA
jgi:heme/copper-type cytochrome/quinol oxidase subunit 4